MVFYILVPSMCENKEQKTFLPPQPKKRQVNVLNQQRFLMQPIAELTGFSAVDQTSRLFTQTQRFSCTCIFF